MDIVFCIRCCDQEHQCNKLPIQRIKIHTILNYHCCQSRFCYRIAFSMRNGDSFSDSCRTFFFSCIYLLSICFFIIDLFALYHEINDLVECFVFALWRCIQKNTSCIQQICDSHMIFPPVDKYIFFATLLSFMPYTSCLYTSSTSGLVARYSENALALPVATPIWKACS